MNYELWTVCGWVSSKCLWTWFRTSTSVKCGRIKCEIWPDIKACTPLYRATIFDSWTVLLLINRIISACNILSPLPRITLACINRCCICLIVLRNSPSIWKALSMRSCWSLKVATKLLVPSPQTLAVSYMPFSISPKNESRHRLHLSWPNQ